SSMPVESQWHLRDVRPPPRARTLMRRFSHKTPLFLRPGMPRAGVPLPTCRPMGCDMHPTLGGTAPASPYCPPVACMAVRSMYSRADYYRRRGCEAQERAAQTSEEEVRGVFRDVAAGWFMLAELMDCLNGVASNEIHKKSPGEYRQLADRC